MDTAREMPPPNKRKAKEKAPRVESSDSEPSDQDDIDRYAPYRVNDYSRRYPEDSAAGFEFVVFVESTNDVSIGTRDLMHLSRCFMQAVKGIKYLKKLNKFKIGVYFDRPNIANAFLENVTFLRDQNLRASIPAGSTELTGVINSVPVNMSNKQIFHAISSTQKKIISVRRIMKKVKIDAQYELQPTQSVAITFSSSISLPDFVLINMWRFPVSQYIPPVKQCYKCLRYGHLAKFCKNSERCSVCGESHSFKSCTVSQEKAVCIHCKGNHLAISGECPIKKAKIEENKKKYSPSSFADLFNNQTKHFPSLNQNTNSNELLNMILSNKNALGLLTECLVKVITLNKTENTSISSQFITNIIKETLQEKNNKPSHSPVN